MSSLTFCLMDCIRDNNINKFSTILNLNVELSLRLVEYSIEYALYYKSTIILGILFSKFPHTYYFLEKIPKDLQRNIDLNSPEWNKLFLLDLRKFQVLYERIKNIKSSFIPIDRNIIEYCIKDFM